jgi:hypothetical protein
MRASETGVALDAVSYQPEFETYRFGYDKGTADPGMAVVTALSEVMEADPTTLAPLYDTVDLEALDALVRARDDTDGDVHVSWTHEGYAVTVHSYGMITVAPAGGDRPEDWSEGVRHR